MVASMIINVAIHCRNERVVLNQLGISQLQSTKHFSNFRRRKDPLGQLVIHQPVLSPPKKAALAWLPLIALHVTAHSQTLGLQLIIRVEPIT